jgi:hypothetical protein
MQHDPNAETFEIPVLRIQEQMARIAARSRQDRIHERLYDPLTATQPMPVVRELPRHRKAPAPRSRGWTARRNEVAMLVCACMALVGTGLAWRMGSPVNIRPAADVRPTPQATTSAPFIGPTIPAVQPTRAVVPVAQATPTKAPSPTRSPSRTRRATTPRPIYTKAVVVPPSPSPTPSPTLSKSPSPTTTPSPSPSASSSSARPRPTPLVSITVGL